MQLDEPVADHRVQQAAADLLAVLVRQLRPARVALQLVAVKLFELADADLAAVYLGRKGLAKEVVITDAKKQERDADKGQDRNGDAPRESLANFLQHSVRTA